MKKLISKILLILAPIVAIVIILSVIDHPFTLQYVDDNGDMITETFNSTKEFNERAKELKEDSIKYYLYIE